MQWLNLIWAATITGERDWSELWKYMKRITEAI
jgi:hypothetical protein